MKNIFLVIAGFFALSFTTGWEPDFETAKQVAKEKHQMILLNFSGSDWCGPCIRMKREIFDSESFLKMAETSLVLVNADFPRSKKHQLSAALKNQNDLLAEKYNPGGKFPFTILMDENGKIVRSWEGLPDINAEEFTKEVARLCNSKK
jgi:thioredoxin-related protein